MRIPNPSRLAATGLLAAAMAAGAPVAQAAAVVTPLADGSVASATALVNTLLAPSANLTLVAGSARYSGAASASGTFSGGGGANGVGIAGGVVLTSGDARFIGSSAAFAGDAANQSGTFTAGVGNALSANTAGGNAVFAALTPEATFNASVLSFSIVPQYGTLTLRLVFGSEDYNDVVNSGFPTDVVGVFVNGVNRALVPGSNLAISASTINCGGPTSGPATGSGPNCALYRDNAPFLDTIDSEVDGWTTVLSLSLAVDAGQVNSIAIGIADTLDTSGDSALLLAAGSVAAVPEPATWALLLLGGLAAVAARRNRTTISRSDSHGTT